MKIICETKREVNTITNCRREYCCDEMKVAMSSLPKDKHAYNGYHPTMEIRKIKDVTDKKEYDILVIQTHRAYECGPKYAQIYFCPWCSKKIKITHEKIDNTGLPPVEKVPCVPQPKKKKHWWN